MKGNSGGTAPDSRWRAFGPGRTAAGYPGLGDAADLRISSSCDAIMLRPVHAARIRIFGRNPPSGPAWGRNYETVRIDMQILFRDLRITPTALAP
jgi:hypothetical protein